METNETKPKRQPTNLFDNKERYLAFKKEWARLASEKKLTATMVFFYNLARGKPFRTGFTPITNTVKLTNGQKPDAGYNRAMWAMRLICFPKHKLAEEVRAEFIGLFNGIIDDEFVTKVSNYLNGDQEQASAVIGRATPTP